MAFRMAGGQHRGRRTASLRSVRQENIRCGYAIVAAINFDSRVNAEDLGIMLAAWGDAPRNDYPPSDCPLGLIP